MKILVSENGEVMGVPENKTELVFLLSMGSNKIPENLTAERPEISRTKTPKYNEGKLNRIKMNGKYHWSWGRKEPGEGLSKCGYCYYYFNNLKLHQHKIHKVPKAQETQVGVFTPTPFTATSTV